MQHAQFAFDPGEQDPQPEHQEEGDEGKVLVEDDLRRHPAGEADHRLGDDEEQPVDEIVVPAAAGQQGQQALAEERQLQ